MLLVCPYEARPSRLSNRMLKNGEGRTLVFAGAN